MMASPYDCGTDTTGQRGIFVGTGAGTGDTIRWNNCIYTVTSTAANSDGTVTIYCAPQIVWASSDPLRRIEAEFEDLKGYEDLRACRLKMREANFNPTFRRIQCGAHVEHRGR